MCLWAYRSRHIQYLSSAWANVFLRGMCLGLTRHDLVRPTTKHYHSDESNIIDYLILLLRDVMDKIV